MTNRNGFPLPYMLCAQNQSTCTINFPTRRSGRMDILVNLGELRVKLAKLIIHSDAKLTFCKEGHFDLLKTWLKEVF